MVGDRSNFSTNLIVDDPAAPSIVDDMVGPAMIGAVSTAAGILAGTAATPVLGPTGAVIVGGAVEGVIQHVLNGLDVTDFPQIAAELVEYSGVGDMDFVMSADFDGTVNIAGGTSLNDTIASNITGDLPQLPDV
jgi:hypothetical protein